ncbi:hypothetical protein BpHYR1_049861 [Brachionus plicatilis]|uniref:Uncharacterized protein n=1 Tax=Brachionus plicatilis TaxID=10195 RepID=A0A3M7SU03_BRAPC|nr:hypothetical protein BpHYR1_049861 [Brachionus plicatilis]
MKFSKKIVLVCLVKEYNCVRIAALINKVHRILPQFFFHFKFAAVRKSFNLEPVFETDFGKVLFSNSHNILNDALECLAALLCKYLSKDYSQFHPFNHEKSLEINTKQDKTCFFGNLK